MKEFILIMNFVYALLLGYFAIEWMSRVFRKIQMASYDEQHQKTDISIGIAYPFMLKNAKILSLKIEHRTHHHCAIYQGDLVQVEKALRHKECKIAIFYQTPWRAMTSSYQMLEKIENDAHIYVYYRSDLDPQVISILKECVQLNSSLFTTHSFLQQPF